jgi:ribosomal protein S21
MGEHVPPPFRARDLCVVRVYGDLDQATRVFRKQVQKARIISEIRDRRNHITRSERRTLKDIRARKRMKRSRKRYDNN